MGVSNSTSKDDKRVPILLYYNTTSKTMATKEATLVKIDSTRKISKLNYSSDVLR
jgi:hypothetical protein